MADKKILLGLTTTRGSDWRAKVEEINRFGIKEISLFPTVLEIEQRRELYSLLEKTGLETIPHVHLRNQDMEIWELDFLSNNYKTQVFNIHPCQGSYEFIDKNPQYRDKIFVENLLRVYSRESFCLDYFKKHNIAGICLDFSHLALGKEIIDEEYKKACEIIKFYPIGCNHISGFKKKFFLKLFKSEKMASHQIPDNSWLDYLKNFPAEYFSQYLSIELENSFEEQLEIKKYLEKIIK